MNKTRNRALSLLLVFAMAVSMMTTAFALGGQVNIKFADRRRYYDTFDAYYSPQRTAAPLVELLVEYETAELEKRLALLEQI